MRKRISGSTLQEIASISRAGFSTWIHSARTILILAFVLAVCYVHCETQTRNLALAGRSLNILEMMAYIMLNGCNMTVMSILFLITNTELPLRTRYQYMMLSRTKRFSWVAAQVLYCVTMSIFMVVLVQILCLILLPALGVNGFSNVWSENVLVERGLLSSWETVVPEYIRLHFTPVGTLLLSAAVSFLFWFSMVLFVLLLSMMRKPVIGISLYVILLLANLIFLVEAMDGIPTPVQLSTVSGIFRVFEDEKGGLQTTFIGYGIYVFLLTSLLFPVSRKQELAFDNTSTI